MNYPFKDRPHFQRSAFKKLATWYETFRITSRERRQKTTVDMSKIGDIVPLRPNDLPLVFITHNDMTLISKFLLHYRKLGVTRFICVDDISKDGTREYLLEQSDVDVWTSPVRYSDARRGRRWREQLFGIYGLNRWYLNVDSDEFLVYDGFEENALVKLITLLEAQGEKRLAAPMLDMYSSDNAVHPSLELQYPWEFSQYFDSDGYTLSFDKRGASLTGGPRSRKFGETNELMKYPLILWDGHCFFGSSPHRPLPYERNFAKLWGALLHFKFYTNYKEKISEAAQEQQHYDGSKHYKTLMSEIDAKGSINLQYEKSEAFIGASRMVELGFISKIDWTNQHSPKR